MPDNELPQIEPQQKINNAARAIIEKYFDPGTPYIVVSRSSITKRFTPKNNRGEFDYPDVVLALGVLEKSGILKDSFSNHRNRFSKRGSFTLTPQGIKQYKDLVEGRVILETNTEPNAASSLEI